MEEKKTKMNKIPDVIGKYEYDARDFLERKKIKVQKHSVKKFNLEYKSGTVIDINPPVGTKISENKRVKLYVASNRLFTLILTIIVLILAFLGYKTYKHSYVMLNVQGPTISLEKDEYVKTNVVRVTKKSELNNATGYQYCKTTNTSSKNCIWIDFKGEEFSISDSGSWNVYVRAYNKNNNKYSSPSESVKVLIDRESPRINNVSFIKNKEDLTVEIDAIDSLSGIKSYLYSIDGTTYLETYSKFKLYNIKVDKIYVKVIDNLDNETIKIVNI